MKYLTEEKFEAEIGQLKNEISLRLTKEEFEAEISQRFAEADQKVESRLDEHFRFINEFFRDEFSEIRGQLTTITQTVEKIYQMLDRDVKWRGEHEADHAAIHERVDRVETYLGPGFRKTLSA